ncbi:hypothetical protein [Desulfosporosinus sp. SB140]
MRKPKVILLPGERWGLYLAYSLKTDSSGIPDTVVTMNWVQGDYIFVKRG